MADRGSNNIFMIKPISSIVEMKSRSLPSI